jgi:hypothetical protein
MPKYHVNYEFRGQPVQQELLKKMALAGMVNFKDNALTYNADFEIEADNADQAGNTGYQFLTGCGLNVTKITALPDEIPPKPASDGEHGAPPSADQHSDDAPAPAAETKAPDGQSA